jgi:hypothetical protein
LNVSEEFTKIRDDLDLLNSSLQSRDRSPFIDLILSDSHCTTTEKLESEIIVPEDIDKIISDKRNINNPKMKFTKRVEFNGKRVTSFSPVIKCAKAFVTKPPLTPGVKLNVIKKASKIL